MKTVVIYSHSYQTDSVTNRVIVEELARLPHVEVRNLEQLYPDGQIDVAAEQAALLAADTVVFHHPIFWFNMPPLLKRWMDEVLQYGFAYGSTGDKLKGKNLLHSFTMGTPAQMKTPEFMEMLIAPVRMAAGFCSMNYAGEVCTFGQSAQTNPNRKEDGLNHAQRVAEALAKLG